MQSSRPSTLVSFLAILALAGTAAATDEPVHPQMAWFSSFNPLKLSLFDANGDGLTDAALTSSNQAYAVISRQPFSWVKEVDLSVNQLPQDIDTGDVDGDGDGDVICVNGTKLAIVPGHGDGSFGPRQDVTLPLSSAVAALADADGDGDLDVLVGASSQSVTYVARNQGASPWTFGPNLSTGSTGVKLDSADIDANGVLDYAVAAGSSIVIVRGTGGGNFALGLPVSAASVRDFEFCNIVPDGFPDIAWVGTGALENCGTRAGLGGGSFASSFTVAGVPATSALNDGMSRVDAQDVDADGDDDLCIVPVDGLELWIALTAGGSAAVPANGTLSLGQRMDAQLADADADGRIDIVHAGGTPNTIDRGLVALRGLDAPLAFEAPIVWTPPEGTGVDLVTGDLNGDGRDDVLLPLFPANSVARALLSVGPGVFGPPLDSNAGSGAWKPRAVADLDGDGAPEALGYVSDAATKDVNVLHGVGDGSFVPGSLLGFTTNIAIGGVATADFDLDGDVDIVAGSNTELGVASNDGAGGFALVLLGGQAGRVAAGDVNGDGLPDLMDVTYTTGTGKLEQRLNLGAGFAPPLLGVDGTTMNISSISLGDIDGDGRADMQLAGALAGEQFTVFRSLPGGGWQLAATVGSTSNIMSLPRLVDVTGDGLADPRGTQLGRVYLLPSGAGVGAKLQQQSAAPFTRSFSLDADGDGTQDLLFEFFTTTADRFETLLARGGQSWWSLGHGLAGADGHPGLRAEGALLPGETSTMDLSNAPPNAPALLVAGLNAAFLPFKSGTLVPSPDVVLQLATDGNGELHVSMPWPPGLPAGFDVFLQVWVPDAGAPSHQAASNALRAVAQ